MRETEIISKFKNIIPDLFALAIVVLFGWFLIGYYADYQFLATGYQDWIYHAFRIKSIEMHGIVSWDNIWSNGLNHWRAYQYVFHVVVLYISKIAHISITVAMLWSSILSFIGLRVLIYVVLRKLKISRFFATFFVIISYDFSQQWIAVSDFSMLMALTLVPGYMFFWIYSLKNKQYLYLLAALTGALWSVHPVLGYSLTGLFFFSIIFSNFRNKKKQLFLSSVIFLISSMPFSVPYLLGGYRFMNPLFASPQFLRETLRYDYFGLSLIFFIFLFFSWVILFIKSNGVEKWAKILLFYCSFYIVLIYFGQNDYLPRFINQFQISRAIPLIAIILIFCFASLLQTLLNSYHSRFIPTIMLIIMAFSMVRAVETSSNYSAHPVKLIENPVAIYFSDKIPTGSIYFQNVSEASFFANDGLHYATSYNEHLQPNPYSTRLTSLMKTDYSYMGVSMKQINLIDDYATVLGIEYIVIPSLSPLVNGLTVDNSQPAMFEEVGEVATTDGLFSILKNKNKIHYAYAFENNFSETFINLNDLPQPTLYSDSYIPWDDEINRVAGLIRGELLKPIPLTFVNTDQLNIDISSLEQPSKYNIFIAQSFDNNWKIENIESAEISPTSLRFMQVKIPQENSVNEIVLKNSWPSWHWPVQAVGILTIFFIGGLLFIKKIFLKK